MNIAQTDLRIKKLKELEQKFAQGLGNHLYIWGAAETAERVRLFIEGNSRVRVRAYVVDDEFYDEAVSGLKQAQDASGAGTYSTKQVWKASDWLGTVKEGDAVWIGFVGFERGRQLAASLPKGVEGIFFSYPISGIIQGKILTYEHYNEHRKDFEWVYGRMADEKSRRTLEGFINACISGSAQDIEREHMAEHYFNDITGDYPVRCMVDCGAYTGDTVEAAAGFYADLDTVIAFEPDRQNMGRLKQMAGRTDLPVKNWGFIEKASWSEKTELCFKAAGQASCVSGDGEVRIPADTIDHVLAGMAPVKVDFIKMDVEGSEKESLSGARETIRKDHPVLAVSVYHKIEDLYEIPRMIEDIGGGAGRRLCLLPEVSRCEPL